VGGVIAANLKAMGDAGQCWVAQQQSADAAGTPAVDDKLPATPSAACSDSTKGLSRLALLTSRANLQKAADLMKTATASSVAMKTGSAKVGRITDLLKRKDSKIESLRQLTYEASHMSDF